MQFLFFIIGAVFGFVFILSNLVRTVRRERQIRWIELVWVFMTVLLPIAGLVIDNRTQDVRFDEQEIITLLLIIPLLLTGVAFAFVEAFRPQRLRQSRGILSVGSAIVLSIAAAGYVPASFAIQTFGAPDTRRPTPVNITPGALDPCDLIGRITGELFRLLSDNTGLNREELLDLFETGENVTLAGVIEDAGNDPAAFVDDLLLSFEDLVLDVAGRGCPGIGDQIPQNRTLIRFALNQFGIREALDEALRGDVEEVLLAFTQFGGEGGPPEDVDTDAVATSVAGLDDAARQATRSALVQAIPTLPPSATPTATPTITITPSPTQTRTPIATLSPTPQRERYATPTPTLTATLPNPCIASASFNVNMRDYPSLEETEVLLTIPYESVFSVYAPNEDQTWWFAEFDGVAGWVSNDFIQVTRPCRDLPARDPGFR